MKPPLSPEEKRLRKPPISQPGRPYRKTDPDDATSVRLSLNKRQMQHVLNLIEEGTYGNATNAVAMYLFNDGLRRVINDTRGKSVASPAQQP